MPLVVEDKLLAMLVAQARRRTRCLREEQRTRARGEFARMMQVYKHFRVNYRRRELNAMQQAADKDWGAIWRIEGYGYSYARAVLSNLGKNGKASVFAPNLVPGGEMPFYIGVGLYLGNRLDERWKSLDSAHASLSELERFVTLLNAGTQWRPILDGVGFRLALSEPRRLHALFDALPREHEAAMHLWHGAGRAAYFLTPRALSGMPGQWTCYTKLGKIALNERTHSEAIRGLSFAVGLINIAEPAVLEEFVTRHARDAEDESAIAAGVGDALDLWMRLIGRDAVLQDFSAHERTIDEANIAAWWAQTTACLR